MKKTFLILLLISIVLVTFQSCVPSNYAYKKAGYGCPSEHIREAKPSYKR